MTIITLHHLCFGHCVNSSVIVLDLGIFLQKQKNTLFQSNHLRFHTMTSKKMVRTYYCLIISRYRLIQLRHYCSVPEAKLQCTEIRGSHPSIKLDAYRMLDHRCFSMYHSHIDFKNHLWPDAMVAPSTNGLVYQRLEEKYPLEKYLWYTLEDDVM